MAAGAGPAAVLFDMGGTLEEVTRSTRAAARGESLIMERLLAEGVLQTPWPEGTLIARIEAGLLAYKREMYLAEGLAELRPYELWSRWLLPNDRCGLSRLTETLAEELSLAYETRCLERRLRPEAVPLIGELARRGYLLGVISNSISCTQVERTLQAYGLRQAFGAVRVSAVSGRRKPHPMMFLDAAGELGVLPGRCVYVGDTFTRDVLGARAAGYGYALLLRSPLGQEADDRDADDLLQVSSCPPIRERSITGLGEVLGALEEFAHGTEGGRAG